MGFISYYDSYDRIIMLLDVNSAYLAWTAEHMLQHGYPVDIRTIPSVVGGDELSRHGIVLAKSIPAKAYNIVTGESLFAVRQRCPKIFIAPPDYPLFMKAHRGLFYEALAGYCPDIQVSSIDEGFLEFTFMRHIWPDPIAAAYEIKEHVRKHLGFTISIGISSNKLLAKMAAELKKPDAVSTLFPDEIPVKLWPLPVEDLYRVGRATTEKLHRVGIYTIGQIAKLDPSALRLLLKNAQGQIVWNYANGIECSRVGDRPQMKGLGNSQTIPFDIDTREEAYLELLALTETVCMRLRQTGYCASLAGVSIGSSEFEYSGHQRKFVMPTDSTMDIYNVVAILFDQLWKGQRIRKLGVRLSELCDKNFVQLTIFQKYNERHRRLDSAIDGIRMKHGPKSAMRGSFVNSGFAPMAGGVMSEDYQMMSSIL